MPTPASTSLRAAALTAALLGAGATSAHAAPTILSTEAAPTLVAAQDGTVMLSQRNPATGAFRLVRSVDGGTPVPVGVPERDAPFDMDLGTNAAGAPYAVYTRNGFLYRLRVSTGAEQRLTRLSIGGQNQRPSIHRGRIAFLHSGRGRSELRIGTTGADAGRPRVLVRGVIDDVEIGAKHVAYTTFRERSPGATKRVRIRNIATGRDRAVYTATSGGANAAGITKPSFTEDERRFVWARTNLGSGTGNRVVRYTLRTSRLSYAPGSGRYATTAWAGDRLGLAFSRALDPIRNGGCEDAGIAYCQVGFTGPLRFTSRP